MTRSFIIISEDGSPYGKIIKDCDIDIELLEQCDDGILSLIDITNPLKPLEYYQNKWNEIENYEW